MARSSREEEVVEIFGNPVHDNQRVLRVDVTASDVGNSFPVVLPEVFIPEGFAYSTEEIARILISLVVMLPLTRVEIASLFLEGADHTTNGIVKDLLARGKASQELEGVDMDEEIRRLLS